MRIIPRNTNVKNTVWRCWGARDIGVALFMLVFVLIFLSTSRFAWMAVFSLLTVALLMPTPDGMVYELLFGYAKYFFSTKEFCRGLGGRKEISKIYPVRAIRESGVLEYADGRKARIIAVGQKNFGIEDEETQDADIERFSSALKLIGPGQSADLIKTERPVNLDAFSTALKSELESFGAEAAGVPSVRRRILLARLEETEKITKNKKKYFPVFFFAVYGRELSSLESTALAAAAELERCGLPASILGGRDAAVFLKSCHVRDFDEKEADGKSMRELLSWVSPKKVCVGARGVKEDGLFSSIFAVTDFPMRVKNAWAAALCGEEGTKTVFHMRPVDRAKAIKRIDRCVSESETKSLTSYRASEAAGAETHRESMLELLDSLQRDNETLFDVSVTVTVYDFGGKDMKEKKTGVRGRLSGANFRLSNLYAAQAEAYLASNGVPEKKALSHYERGINSSSLAAAFPFVRSCPADPGGLLLGFSSPGGYPFVLNIWKRGDDYQNSNAMIIGKSGSGKSFFLKSLVASEWSRGTRVMILDPESEYGALAKSLGGRVIDVGNAAQGRINPFHVYRILTEDGSPAAPAVTFKSHLKTLESFFRVALEGITSDTLELINNLVVEAYAKRGITEETDCSAFTPDMFPTFSDLLEVVDGRARSFPDEFTAKDLRCARTYLLKFVTGRYSDIWNGPSTLDASAGAVDFDFRSLFASRNGIVANAQMLLVFRFMEQEVINAREKNISGEEAKILVAVDEAHMFIDRKYPVALDFFSSMCKRIRKYGGAFVPATQNIADWNSTEELRGRTSAIMKNSQYMFVFKLSSPDMNDLTELYRGSEGFNDEERRRVLSFSTGEALFVGSSKFRTCVKIRTPDAVRSLFGEGDMSRPGK